LPWSCKWYVPVLAGVTASALGKMIFGGLGQNLFNPAMVGRAFVMICFAGAMGASAYIDKDNKLNDPALTGATPMTSYKQAAQADSGEQGDDAHNADEAAQPDEPTSDSAADDGDSQPAPPARASLLSLFLGNVGGSLGETSALACIIGGAYLLLRRTAAWQAPLGAILTVVVIAGIAELAGAHMTMMEHLLGGALLFGALFIATDPVTSPLTPLGRFIFGVGVGGFVMLLRLASSYPEGVMFAVLLMNAVVPLINRWTIPRPVGGPVPSSK
ncbi:MAG: RnfABCDGE type electron transport complex subunit D, partial [Phycisphaerae bacterium]|nr:RnfABCDGE type electron transport complex subunit D [Phycisphaerae bacterium]